MCPGEGGWKDCALMPHWGVPGFLADHISSVRRLDAFFGLDHLELKHPSCLPHHDGMQRQTSGNKPVFLTSLLASYSFFLFASHFQNFTSRHIQMQFFRLSGGADIYAQNVYLRVRQFGVRSGRAPAPAGCLCSLSRTDRLPPPSAQARETQPPCVSVPLL